MVPIWKSSSAAFHVFTGDAANLRLKVLVWTEALEEHRMWGNHKAYKYAPCWLEQAALSEFTQDVKRVVGNRVQTRRRELRDLCR